MTEKSHRVPQVCNKSGVDALSHTTTRRLDGYSLYSANHVRIRAERQAIIARFDQPHASSDGGAILLKGIDTQLQLTKRVAGCLASDGASVWGDALRRAALAAQAAGHHQSRGRAASGPRSQEQPPLRGDQPPRRPG